MSLKLLVDAFKWKRMLKFNEDFIKNYDEDSDKEYSFEIDVKILKIYMICIVIYHSYQRESKLINVISLSAICIIKKTMLFI